MRPELATGEVETRAVGAAGAAAAAPKCWGFYAVSVPPGRGLNRFCPRSFSDFVAFCFAFVLHLPCTSITVAEASVSCFSAPLSPALPPQCTIRETVAFVVPVLPIGAALNAC